MRYAHCCVAVAWLALSAPAQAQAPVLPVQGTLRAMAGNLVNDTRMVTFRLYNDDTGGNPFYEVEKTVIFTNGQFVAYLGDQEPIDAADFDGQPEVWLGIEVSPETVEMSPRVRLGAAPFALYAQMCGSAQSAMDAQTASTATSETTATTASTAEDLDCTGCVESDEISYVVYRGPNSGTSRTDTTSTTTECGPEIAAKFCAVAFVGITGMVSDNDELQCFVARPRSGIWQVCARGNGTTRAACAMNCMQ